MAVYIYIYKGAVAKRNKVLTDLSCNNKFSNPCHDFLFQESSYCFPNGGFLAHPQNFEKTSQTTSMPLVANNLKQVEQLTEEVERRQFNNSLN